MQSMNLIVRRVATIAILVTLSLGLASCPPTPEPEPGSGALRLVVTTGFSASPVEKGLSAIADDEVIGLEVTVQQVTLRGGSGTPDLAVLAAPVVVNLAEMAAMSRLVADVAVKEGSYSGIGLMLSSASLTLSGDPSNPITLQIPNGGSYEISYVFDVMPEATEILMMDFGGLNLFLDEQNSIVFQPAPAFILRGQAPAVRVEGQVNGLNRGALTFDLASEGTDYSVNFSGASIYIPGDLESPTGTPDDLENGQMVAALGALGTGNTFTPSTIEIVDLPDTGENEEGDQITLCHFHAGMDGSGAYTIVVSRAVLQAHLDHGDFAGPCDEGDTFTVTYTAGEGGTLSGDATQMIAPGENGTAVTAVADEGFVFVDWSDGRTDNPRTDTAVGSNFSVTANFTETFLLQYTAGEGGTLSGQTTQRVLPGGSGTQVTAVRNTGYVFSEWSDGSTQNPRTDQDVTEDIEVTANFLPMYTLSYTATEGGTLEGNTNQTVIAGEDGTPVTALPATDFVFATWSDGRMDNPRTDLNVSSSIAVVANFSMEYTLAYSAGPNGSIVGVTPQIVPGGLDGTPVMAVSDDGFGFVRWSDGRTDNPRIDAAITGDVSVVAEFATAVNLFYAAGPNGSLSGMAEQIVGLGGTSSAVTAVPNEGYGFLEWSDGRTDNPRIDAGVIQTINVTATFSEAFELSYEAGPNGRIVGESSQTVIAGRDGDSVTAVADDGFAFERWSDGRTDNPRADLRVDADVSVSASFVEVFRLTYIAGPNGSLTGSANQSIPAGGSGSAITAHASSGFGFLEWSDGRTDNPRIDTDVHEDITVTANFAQGISLSYTADENGTLAGDTSQLLTNTDTGSPVTAVPDEGYLFLDWSDGRTDNPRVDAGVTQEVIVRARYFRNVEMLVVPGGTFTMGRTDSGDDLAFDADDELPRHDVTLSEYEIGKYEVTNDEYAVFMNYLNHPSRDLLRRTSGQPWEGHNEAIYFDNGGEELTRIYLWQFGEVTLGYDRPTATIIPLVKEGLPEGTLYDLGDHPVTEPSWFGAILYCNWLSERSGYDPVYDISTWEGDFSKNGYRLPTEAEWERAAAWDGEKHWIYGFTADSLSGPTRANYYDGPLFVPPPDFGNDEFVNPLGILQDQKSAYTSPVGWFNGVNISPNGNVQTVDSKSPVGAYDMTGNLFEWCHDWYSSTYYNVSAETNPKGPAIGLSRVVRGGAWGRQVSANRTRSAYRYQFDPTDGDGIIGIRLARTTGQTTRYTLSYEADENGAISGANPQSVVVGGDGTTVTAVPNSGYGFVRWSDGITENPRTDMNVTRDVTVTAEFAPAVHLTYLAGANGRIEGPAEQIVGSGGIGASVTAVGEIGFGFLSWSDGSLENPRVDQDVTEDITVTANFSEAFVVVYLAGDNGQVEGETNQIILAGRDGTPVTAVPNDGFGFAGWSDGSTDNPRSEHVVSADLTVTAEFVPRYRLTYTAGANGSLTGELLQEVNEGNSGSAVTAVPNEGFSFIGWSDGVRDNPRIDFDVMGNVNVTANFLSQITLSYTAGANGSLQGETQQIVDAASDGTAVTAVPEDGYLFLQWSDGSTDNPRIDTDVIENVAVQATFFAQIEMIAVPGGTFTMGRTDTGDDALFGFADELPRHDVTLSDYEIGKYEITNEQYTVFLNYLLDPSRNHLRRENGSVWRGHSEDIFYFETESPQKIFAYRLGEVNVRYNGTTRLISPVDKPGLPDGTFYNMAPNPVTEPTWYGAVLYCNWLSERAGLEPVYNIDTWEGDLSKNGYRLPTEAEWERAAAWDGERHWIYGFMSDTLSGRARCNYHDGPWDPPPDFDNDKFVNPLGLVQDAITPYTNPVGWFNGVNVSPNGNVQTIDSPSPVGAYDMSGNMVEWCHDWYSNTYYSTSPSEDPLGPETGTERVARGGAWARLLEHHRQRTAKRYNYEPGFADGIIGFRLAR